MHTDTFSCRHTEAHADTPTFVGVGESAKGCSAGGFLVAYSCTDAHNIHTERVWQVAGHVNKHMRPTSCSLVDHFFVACGVGGIVNPSLMREFGVAGITV